MEKDLFKDVDLNNFWKKSDYALAEYVESFPDDELIASIEKQLGYKFPVSYIKLMRTQNGGFPEIDCHPTTEPINWAEDHIAITGFLGIGRTKSRSLCGAFGSRFWIDEWEYPDDGMYICDCPSGGHDMILLDYSNCVRDGEPEVVHVDAEGDFKKTFLAKDFETFVCGLVHEVIYDTSEQDMADTLGTIRSGRFSDTLKVFFQENKSVDFERVLRNIFTELVHTKGYFALHGDPLSHLAYDIRFYLLTANHKITTWEEFIGAYPQLVALGNNEITTGGYAEGFVKDWFDDRIRTRSITKGLWFRYRFSDSYRNAWLQRVMEYEQKN